jgi:2-isopropylmalate synthase
VPAKRIYEEFLERLCRPAEGPDQIRRSPDLSDPVKGRRNVEAIITDKGKEVTINGTGTGPIDGFVDALSKVCRH